MQAVHHLFRQMLTLLLVLLTTATFAGWLLLDQTPLLTPQAELNADTVKHSKQLLTNLNQSIRNPNSAQWIIATDADELNSAFRLASRTLPGFQGQAQLNDLGLTTLMTVPLRIVGQQFYLNATIQISPSSGPLQIDKVKIGMLTVPGGAALTLVGWAADQVWGPGKGAELLAMVRSVKFEQNAMKVELAKPSGWNLQKLKQSGFSAYRELFSSPQQRADIEFYYQIALQYAATAPNSSLVNYLQLLFQQAEQRSQDDPAKAAAENQAALLALGQLLGGQNLQLLVNEVKRPSGVKAPRVTLARRPDLQQHFVYSAAIQLLTSRDVSNTVGEAKELLDSIKGGSGFSFVDLLADRAGVRFAMIATASPESARAVQQFFREQRQESEIFPSKARLPEGLSQQLFEQHFQSVDSVVYQQMVQEIDRRLDALPLYQIKTAP